MRLSLAGRMFAALFGVSAVMVAVVLGWAGWALRDGFAVYLNNRSLAGMDRVALAVEESYAQHGGWAGIADNPVAWEAVLRRQGPPPRVPGWPQVLPAAPQVEPGGVPPEPPPEPPPEAPAGPPMGPPPGPPSVALDGPLGAPLAGMASAAGEAGQDVFGHQGPRGPHGDPTADYLRPRLVLLDAHGHEIAGPADGLSHPGRRVLSVAGRAVGELRFDAGEPSGGPEAAFLAARFTDLYGAGAAAILLSALAALLISRNILVPVRLVAEGARRLAAGDFSTRLHSARGDELGQLVLDFNALAAALDAAEQSRRRWVADTSHELRTPLSVLRAQIEAMQDGVRVADAGTLAGLHAEVMRMARLVADLHELSRADSAALSLQKRSVQAAEVMRGVLQGAALQLAARGLRAVDDLAAQPPLVLADPDRLRQVFSNIVDNAMRYTDTGGTIRVSARAADGKLLVCVEDSAPGVAAERLPRLFDRFYRGEDSRSRATGGSGLGLAICKAIVEAHGGRIAASASPLGGLAVTVALPLAGSTAA